VESGHFEPADARKRLWLSQLWVASYRLLPCSTSCSGCTRWRSDSGLDSRPWPRLAARIASQLIQPHRNPGPGMQDPGSRT
jgi:hypothetical protein